MDWYMFGCTLNGIIEELRGDWNYNFELIMNLTYILTNEDYFTRDDFYELVVGSDVANTE